MFKLVKEKMLVTLVVVLLMVMVFGNVSSLATTVLRPTNTASGNSNTAIDNTVGATNTAGNTSNTSNTANTNKSNAVSSSVSAVNNTSNTSKYSNTNTNTNKSASKLPYAGSNSSMVFVVVALIASAIYAYKKVSDYNI